MFHDLGTSPDQSVERTTTVCVVGAGLAGIFLAHSLSKHGVRILLVEAGSKTSLAPSSCGVQCLQHGTIYRGAELGRNFGLGGTSATWGGQLISLSPGDFKARSAVGCDAWPITFSEIEAYYEQVRAALRLPANLLSQDESLFQERYPELHRLSPELQLRLSEWLPFRARNFAQFFRGELEQDAELEVWLNAAVVDFVFDRNSDKPRLRQILACNSSGKTLRVRANFVVFCAGALESTRLMLAYDEASQGAISRTGAPLGRYFSDHLSVSAGRFRCRNWGAYNRLTAPLFQAGLMRTPRLELSTTAQQRHRVTSAFAHFTFVTHGDTGFDVVKSWLRKRQGKHEPHLNQPWWLVGRVVRDLATLAYWRGRHRQLWIPRRADILLQIDIEQTPNWSSQLSLAKDRDRLGGRLLAIDWQIGDADLRALRTMAEIMGKAWRASPLKEVADLEMTLPSNLDSIDSIHDVYHPTGTLRMGLSPDDSVVNKDLRLWAADNVYIVSTAVFRSAGSANPTFTELALTARLAEHLAQRIV